ncbi:MAG: nucleoside triphosphate pyrophosphohydrolase [Candidatus Aenigmarchaeota archaeon]|nr:nucleoside triphosphate pyrophosphohydrolase [Candidatus Aenigmarchaeota archaeon]
MKYNKLVRDKIPELIKQNNQVPVTHVADEKEYWKKLKDKLTEEVEEFLESANEEELADILEVVYALGENIGTDQKRLESLRKKKCEERGRFKDRIILDETK